jgi:hypothetical protein
VVFELWAVEAFVFRLLLLLVLRKQLLCAFLSLIFLCGWYVAYVGDASVSLLLRHSCQNICSVKQSKLQLRKTSILRIALCIYMQLSFKMEVMSLRACFFMSRTNHGLRINVVLEVHSEIRRRIHIRHPTRRLNLNL